MPAIDQFQGAAELHGIVRRNQNERVIFQRVGKCGFRAVITRPRHTAGILFVGSLRFGAPFRVQPDLMNVGEHAHDRTRKSSAESSRRLECHRNGHWRFHHQISRAFACQIQHRPLPRENSPLGRGNNGGESCAAPSFNALVAQADVVRRAAPWRGVGSVLRTVRSLL